MKHIKKLNLITFALFIFFTLSRFSIVKCQAELGSSNEQRSIYKIGQCAHIGHFLYTVNSISWRDYYDNGLSTDKPNASFLIVSLTIKNKDKKPRTIPPFSLVDENGAKYETCNIGWLDKNKLNTYTSLNPEVQTTGWIIFDIPKTHKYKLEVSGGYWGTESIFIDLNLK